MSWGGPGANPNFAMEAEAMKDVGGTIAFTYEQVLSSSEAFKRI